MWKFILTSNSKVSSIVVLRVCFYKKKRKKYICV